MCQIELLSFAVQNQWLVCLSSLLQLFAFYEGIFTSFITRYKSTFYLIILNKTTQNIAKNQDNRFFIFYGFETANSRWQCFVWKKKTLKWINRDSVILSILIFSVFSSVPRAADFFLQKYNNWPSSHKQKQGLRAEINIIGALSEATTLLRRSKHNTNTCLRKKIPRVGRNFIFIFAFLILLFRISKLLIVFLKCRRAPLTRLCTTDGGNWNYGGVNREGNNKYFEKKRQWRKRHTVPFAIYRRVFRISQRLSVFLVQL